MCVSNALFPINPKRILIGFTTASSTSFLPSAFDILSNIHRVPLTDAALGAHKVSPRTTHNLVNPLSNLSSINQGGLAISPLESQLLLSQVPSSQSVRDQELAWEANYPHGSINPASKAAPPGGFGFYLSGPEWFAGQLREVPKSPQDARPMEVMMGYEVMFEKGWEWGRGGKLPGIYGGPGDAAYGCTGGRKSDLERCTCFDLRLMWRADGIGELYAYLPPYSPNTASILAAPPRSMINADYGASVGRGTWHLDVGRWIAVVQRVKMNSVGKEDGEIQVFIDGKSMLCLTGLVMRTAEYPDMRVQGLHFQTFFGGHTAEWASPKDQRAWFRSVSGAILRPTLEPPAGHDEL
ncbi:polysaccharide lyase family 14 protein [Laetiporus sulphureus 93-53]|uniref:Polysaccharide lyase family 14 protein n=1 Tax=Laetiporus sulphureus 93-53 TaxID=1314785 RepID=A0A165DG77_9APHY|nr:polysaccharide lyase family 14 protein [Laetiporus sulphureus 93-53]KZT04825.1 polysaccharide lyase family 14 protein [Laetiporus sulphureus 93-53]